MISAWRRASFVWGKTDCIMATCNYIRDRTGVDPARPWRGLYDSEASATALYTPYGGVLALFRHGMGLAGFRETDAPQDGSPVVCDVMGKEVAGVFMGGKVAFMAPRGCVEVRAKVLGAWVI